MHCGRRYRLPHLIQRRKLRRGTYGSGPGASQSWPSVAQEVQPRLGQVRTIQLPTVLSAPPVCPCSLLEKIDVIENQLPVTEQLRPQQGLGRGLPSALGQRLKTLDPEKLVGLRGLWSMATRGSWPRRCRGAVEWPSCRCGPGRGQGPVQQARVSPSSLRNTLSGPT